MLISGNIPFKTEVSSVYIFGQLQSGNGSGAAAVSVVLLAISLGVLLLIGAFRRWRTARCRRPMSCEAYVLMLRFGALGYLALLLLVPVGFVFYRAFEHGLGPAWDAVTTPQACTRSS